VAPDPSTAFTTRTGIVSTYDDHRGDGMIVEADGATWWFHCTSIADGSRSIDAGTPVSFAVRPGPTGLEASRVSPRR